MPPLLRYPSDLSDKAWKILAPLLASPEKRGSPPKWPITAACNDIGPVSMSTVAMRSVWASYTQTAIEGQSPDQSIGPVVKNWWYTP